MGISPRTVDFLRGTGHDAVHLHEQGLDRMTDPAILEKSRMEQRILLTHDLGFGDLMAASGAQLPGVIIFRLRDMRPEWVNRYLDSVMLEYSDWLERGAIVSVTEGQIRLRLLPLTGTP
jgi:predicted nuclease of predicted toxin-antitoxin system